MAAFETAIARKPDLADAHYMLGTILRQQGRLDEALTAFREAIRLPAGGGGGPSEPGPGPAAEGRPRGRGGGVRGGAAAAAQERRRAGRRLRRQQRRPDKLKRGDVAGAIDGFREAVRLDPRNADAHLQLGPCARARGPARRSPAPPLPRPGASRPGSRCRSRGPEGRARRVCSRSPRRRWCRAGAGTGAGTAALLVHQRGRAGRPRRDHGVRRPRHQPVPAGDDRLRRRVPRLRRRRLAGHLPRQRHDARRLPAGQGAHQPSLPQPPGRHLRGRDARGGRRRHRLGPGRVRRRSRQRRPRGPVRQRVRPEPALPQPRRRAPSRTSPQRPASLGPRTRWGTGCAFLDYDRDGSPRHLRRQLHRPRPRHRAHARLRALPLQGPARRLRAAGADRRQERPLPQQGRRHLRGRVRAVGDHEGQRDLRPGREHARLRRRRLGRPVRRQRLEPQRALPQQPRRHVRRHRRLRRLRVQPGRQAAGGHGRRHRRLRSQRDDGHLQDQLRRATPPRCTPTPATASARTAPSPEASGSTRGGWDGAPGSSTSTATAGWTCSWPTATCIPRSTSSRPTPATGSARSSIATSATAASRTSPSASGRRSPPPGPPAAPRSATSTTTATWTSWSTTCTTRRTSCASIPIPSAHWLAVRLVGTQSNRSAIGARVRLVAGGATRVEEVRGGGSYNSQNDLRVHFGLGAVAQVDRLEVRWPNGLEEHWTGRGRRSDPHPEGRDGHVAGGRGDASCVGLLAALLLQAAADDAGRAAALAAARAHIADGKPQAAIDDADERSIPPPIPASATCSASPTTTRTSRPGPSSSSTAAVDRLPPGSIEQVRGDTGPRPVPVPLRPGGGRAPVPRAHAGGGARQHGAGLRAGDGLHPDPPGGQGAAGLGAHLRRQARLPRPRTC